MVRRARGLKSMDFNGKNDPYVKLRLGTQTAETRVLMKTNDPVWEEKFVFGVHSVDAQQLQLSVCDYDKFKQDDHIGSCQVGLSHLPCSEAAPGQEYHDEHHHHHHHHDGGDGSEGTPTQLSSPSGAGEEGKPPPLATPSSSSSAAAAYRGGLGFGCPGAAKAAKVAAAAAATATDAESVASYASARSVAVSEAGGRGLRGGRQRPSRRHGSGAISDVGGEEPVDLDWRGTASVSGSTSGSVSRLLLGSSSVKGAMSWVKKVWVLCSLVSRFWGG